MTQSTQTTNASSQTQPWTPQIPYITQGLQGAGTALGQTQANAGTSTYGAPTQFTAGLTPQQLATFNAMVGYGNGSNAASGMVNPSTANLNAGTAGTAGALTGLGAFNPASTNSMANNIAGADQYVQGANIPAQVAQAMVAANQEANQVTLPGINASAAGSGNSDSSRTGIAQGLVQQGLAENAQNLSGALSGQAFGTGANLASNTNTVNNAATLAALTGAGALSNSASQTGLTGLANSITGQGNLYSIAGSGGAGLQSGNQAQDTNQQQAYNFGQNSPYQSIAQFLGLTGANYGGSESQGTSTTTSTPSLLSTIAGGLGAFGGLLGSNPGTTTNANGVTSTSGGSGLLGLSSFLGFSDRRVKENVKKIGEIGGENIYSFNYIGDAMKKKRVGLMAQDVEKYSPKSVVSIGGIKAVHYPSAIDALFAKAA